MSLHYFGTDGFRGESNVSLTADHAYKIGRYMGWHCTEGATKKARVVVGRDTRQSGTMLESAIVAGLTASGADVYLLGVIPTPAVSYVVTKEDFACGVMITASHNPFQDNGIKLVDSEGHKMNDEVLELVEAYIDNKSEIGFAQGSHIGVCKEWEEGRQLYRQHLENVGKGLNLKGMRIGLDCANGASSDFAAEIFKSFGAEVVVTHNTPDGVNINVDCGSTHIDELCKVVKEQHLDCGFAFDGDCDRCIAVDGEGREVNGDKILFMCGQALARKGELPHDMIVTTVMANIGFDKAVREAGLKCEHTDVGDKYVVACMREGGYALGGEQSGHVVFADCEITGDGIVTALKVMHAVCESNMSFTELADTMVEFPQVLINVRVSDKERALNDADVLAAIEEVKNNLAQEGRILVRPSGTEPVVRVLVEASTEQMCNEQAQKVADKLAAV